jgi:hypothetical protein
MEILITLIFLLLILVVPAVRQYGAEMKAQSLHVHIDEPRRPERNLLRKE